MTRSLPFPPLLLLLCIPVPTGAQVRIHRVITAEEGLVQSQVTALHRDATGFLWVGTFGGLCRWDGDRFDVFGRGDGVAGIDIRVIESLGDGSLAVGTYDAGLAILRPNARRFAMKTPQNGLVGSSVRAVMTTRDGEVWVGTENGIAVYSSAAEMDAPVAHLLEGVSIGCLTLAPDGTRYVGTFGNGLQAFRGHSRVPAFDTSSLPGDRVRAVIVDPDGTPWVSLVGNGVWTRTSSGWQAAPWTEDLGGEDVKFFHIRHTGNDSWQLVMGTTGAGVRLWDGRTLDRITEPHGLPSGTVWAAESGVDSVLYLGT